MPHAVVDRLEVVQIEKEHADARAGAGGAFEREVEIARELAAVGKPGELVVIGEMSQLAGALVDTLLELGLIFAGFELCARELFGHVIEGRRQRVELADAGRPEAGGELAPGKTCDGRGERADGVNDAPHDPEANREQRNQNRTARPTQRFDVGSV